MKNKMFAILNRFGKVAAPFALAMAILTANSTCYFFTYQPDTPKCLDKYRMK